MTKLLKVLLLSLTAVYTLISCGGIQEQTQTANNYYSVDSLITKTSANILVMGEVNVKKTVAIDGKSEQKVISFDSTVLENEMRLFRLLDINEPALAFSYETVKGPENISYQLKENEKQTGIINLRVTSDNNQHIVEGLFQENNQIYYTSRRLKLITEKGRIKSYEIAGTQKMMFKDTIHYSVKGEIIN